MGKDVVEVEKSGFDAIEQRLSDLIDKVNDIPALSEPAPGDTSKTGEQEKACMDRLVELLDLIGMLAEETRDNIRKTKDGYMQSDK